MKVIPRASDQFHPSKKNADQQVKFTNADDNSIQTDSHSNWSFSSSGPEVRFWNDEKVIFYTFDLQVNLLFISFAQPVNYSLFKMSWVIFGP